MVDKVRTSENKFTQHTIHALRFQLLLKEHQEIMIMSVLSKKLLKFLWVRHVMDNFRCNRLRGALVRSISLELPLNDGSRSTQAVETKYMVRYMIVEPGTIEEDVEILSFIINTALDSSETGLTS